MATARRVRPDRPLLHAAGAARRARRRRRLRAARARAGHAARGLERHAGRGPALPLHRRPRAARPQGAGGEPERPGGLRRPAARPSRWRWRCRAADDALLAPFARGLLALADAHDCELVGGDTTRGPLTICITVFGEVRARRGAAALGRPRRRRPVGQRHARRRPPGARGVSRHGRRSAATRSRACAGRWSSRRRASPSAWRCAASRAARSTSPTACSATSATSCAAPASAR